MATLASVEQVDSVSTESRKPLVFLDSNVIVSYLEGDTSAARLFQAEEMGEITLAVNGVVLQEVLLLGDQTALERVEPLLSHFSFLSIDIAKAEALLPKVRALRNRLVHSNDILTLSSASDCDYFVTRDALIMKQLSPDGVRVVTPEELAARLKGS